MLELLSDHLLLKPLIDASVVDGDRKGEMEAFQRKEGSIAAVGSGIATLSGFEPLTILGSSD